MVGLRNSGTGRKWRAVGECADRQHGVVSRQQLRALQFSETEIDYGIAAGRLYPVFRGAFAVGHGEVGRNGRLFAAVLACGADTVVSHGTAAALLGLWENEPRLIDVIAPVQAGRRIPGIYRRHTPPPCSRDRWMHAGVPCTSPSRMIVDVAGMVREPSLRKTVEQAAVHGMLNVPEIDRILTGPRRRGSPTPRLVLADWRRYPPAMRIRSPMEAKLLPLLTQHDIPIPRVNEVLQVGDDRFEIDFLWRRERLCVETDGGKYHGNPLARARDSRRNRILAGAGYRVRRISWEDLEDRPRGAMAELTRLLRSA
jgi:very-short-patch-repair endonuclease